MSINFKNIFTTTFFLFLVISIQGCFTKPKEGAPPGRLLTIGQVNLNSERYENAKKAFELLLKKYPNSKHRREALLILQKFITEMENIWKHKFNSQNLFNFIL